MVLLNPPRFTVSCPSTHATLTQDYGELICDSIFSNMYHWSAMNSNTQSSIYSNRKDTSDSGRGKGGMGLISALSMAS